MTALRSTQETDKLEIRATDDGKVAVFDTLTEQFVSRAVPKHHRHDLDVALTSRRESCRPIIVRWIYGLPVNESKSYGITTDG